MTDLFILCLLEEPQCYKTEQRFKSSAAVRHKSRRCSPPPTFGCTRTLAAKKKSSDPSHASPAAPSPCRSQAVPQGHEQKLPFSFWLRPLQLCPARFRGLSGSASQDQICLLSTAFMCKRAPGPGLGKSHRAAWGLGSPNTVPCFSVGWVQKWLRWPCLVLGCLC